MSTASADSVSTTVQRALESWAMMIVEPIENNLRCFDASQPLIISKVDYNGPTTGFFYLIVQESFMRSLAANLLDDENAGDRTLLVDGAKELANLLSGNLLTELFGTKQAYALEAPLVSFSDLREMLSKPLPHLSCFKADDCPIALSITLGE